MEASASVVATEPRGARAVGALDHPVTLECDTAAAPRGTGQMWRTHFTRRYVTIVGKLPNPKGPESSCAAIDMFVAHSGKEQGEW